MNNDDYKSKNDISGSRLRRANLDGEDFRGKNLTNVDFYRAHLSHADFRGANLANTNFYCANLSRANFRGANLRKADSYRADLSCANFRGASLSGINFSLADLSHADFCGADLTNVDFSYANLSHADFTGACIHNPNCEGADMTGVKGLFVEVVSSRGEKLGECALEKGPACDPGLPGDKGEIPGQNRRDKPDVKDACPTCQCDVRYCPSALALREFSIRTGFNIMQEKSIHGFVAALYYWFEFVGPVDGMNKRDVANHVCCHFDMLNTAPTKDRYGAQKVLDTLYGIIYNLDAGNNTLALKGMAHFVDREEANCTGVTAQPKPMGCPTGHRGEAGQYVALGVPTPFASFDSESDPPLTEYELAYDKAYADLAKKVLKASKEQSKSEVTD